ncbi:unnamed protein product [Candida verbasci]|uniref:AMP-dependent synthetase/ligase domain-containing protein n=1 Tax=Candida verbasci TaxID=1227364 RepID=A0A9W4TW38_9ASCO|nr:unnamed protein product [Candida verbasci]
MTSLFSSSVSIDEAFSKLPLNDDVTVSVPLQNTKTDEFSSIYRNKVIGSRSDLLLCVHPSLDTHQKLINFACKKFANRPCLGYRPYNYDQLSSENYYKSFNYNDVYNRKNAIGSGILKHLINNPYLDLNLISHQKVKNHLKNWSNYGIPKSCRSNIDYEIEKNCSFILSIYSTNRLEWLLVDIACSSYSITNTALYETLGPDVSQYILNLTECPIVVTTNDKVEKVIDLKRRYPNELNNLISVVSMDPISLIPKQVIDQAKDLKLVVTDLFEIEKIGHANLMDQLPPNKEAIFTISFTSGTTGSRPKGVMISQGQACAYVSFLLCIEPQAKLNDIAYIYLPLTHLYERQTSMFAFSTGYHLCFPQITIGQSNNNNFELMINDLKILRPTYMSIVPRLLTKLESHIKNKIKELSSNEATRVNEIIEYKINQHSKYDGNDGFNNNYDNYQPYKTLRESIGFDNMKWVQSASAPISPNTIIYLKASLNMGLRQLYGLTESGAAITSSVEYEAKPGTNGSIAPTGEFKLRNVKDMGYCYNNLQGELMLRGPQMFKGYYYNQEETLKAVTEDGWFHSGDIATIDKETGRISIIDRVKNFFKMSQGEYVSPEKIENCYVSSNPQITQLFVYGNSLKSYLIGIVGIEFEKGLKWLNEEIGINKLDMTEHELLSTMNQKDVKLKFLKLLNSNVRDKLNGFEILHNIHIEINPLTVEREVVTPTFKLRRPIASKFFANILNKLYEFEESLINETKLIASKL